MSLAARLCALAADRTRSTVTRVPDQVGGGRREEGCLVSPCGPSPWFRAVDFQKAKSSAFCRLCRPAPHPLPRYGATPCSGIQTPSGAGPV